MYLKRKIDIAINLLRSIPQDGPIELCYSGGKDSDVILELTKMAGIPYDAIYKNTTIDPPGTLAHCRANGVRIVQPKMTFFEIVAQKNLPSRWSRFCCEILKEYKIHDRSIQGIRRAESSARRERYKEPEYCRTYANGDNVRVYLPILEWTDDDVAMFIEDRGIRCAPLYYDDVGRFHVERRLGCIGCPMQADNGISEFVAHPKVFRQIVRAMQRYLDTHPHTNAYKAFGGNAYNVIYKRLFCKTMDDYERKTTSSLFPLEVDVKPFLESYFGVEL